MTAAAGTSQAGSPDPDPGMRMGSPRVPPLASHASGTGSTAASAMPSRIGFPSEPAGRSAATPFAGYVCTPCQ